MTDARPSADEANRRLAVEIGAECGRASGALLLDLLAEHVPAGLSPVVRDALQLDMLGKEYRRITDAEAEIAASGASAEVADAFRISALVGLLTRLRADGPPA